MANTKHAVVRTDNLGGTKGSEQLASIEFYSDASTPAAIDNGMIVALDSKLGREVYKAVAPTATTTKGNLYLVAGVELFYDQTTAHYLTEWVNEAGKPCRAYSLGASVGGYSVTAEALDGDTPEKGKYVTFEAGSTKAKVVSTSDANTFGIIDDTDTTGFGDGKYTYFYIRLLK